MRMLVFDDDAAIGRTVVRTASLAGFDAFAVTDAEEFAEQLRIVPPQVIVLDLQLGATDGVRQLRLIADQRFPGVLVLMSGVEARILETACALARSLGIKVVDVMEKPLSVAVIERMLEDVRRATEPVSLARLRAAINNDELSLDFQPVVTRTPKHLRMLEALVRWDHPEIGRMLPGGFIPMAEGDAATIDALADWVVGAAVDAYRVLAELGICVPLLVNMSARNLLDLTLPDRIEQTLRNGDMPARDLHIEVTETAAIDDFASTIDVVTRLRLKGIVLWLNNFGTGYSTFKILEQIPFSEIKIDRTFVRGMATSRLSRSIVKSISGLAADLEMTCTAEGVDTEQTAEMLEQMGVASLQGDFIGRPMPVESVHVWMSFWTGKLPSATFDAGTIPMRISTPFPAQIATMQVDPGAADVDTDDVQLPPRQTQVMRLLSEGCSVKEIARQLGLGVGTVKVHLSLAYSALGARNRIEAIRRFGALPPLPV